MTERLIIDKIKWNLTFFTHFDGSHEPLTVEIRTRLIDATGLLLRRQVDYVD